MTTTNHFKGGSTAGCGLVARPPATGPFDGIHFVSGAHAGYPRIASMCCSFTAGSPADARTLDLWRWKSARPMSTPHPRQEDLFAVTHPGQPPPIVAHRRRFLQIGGGELLHLIPTQHAAMNALTGSTGQMNSDLCPHQISIAWRDFPRPCARINIQAVAQAAVVVLDLDVAHGQQRPSSR